MITAEKKRQLDKKNYKKNVISQYKILLKDCIKAVHDYTESVSLYIGRYRLTSVYLVVLKLEEKGFNCTISSNTLYIRW